MAGFFNHGQTYATNGNAISLRTFVNRQFTNLNSHAYIAIFVLQRLDTTNSLDNSGKHNNDLN